MHLIASEWLNKDPASMFADGQQQLGEMNTPAHTHARSLCL
jgi:hypothetical protein